MASAVREAGYEVAFTIAWGDRRRRRRPLRRCPRVEVHASDTPRKLRLKLAPAGWPGLLRDVVPDADGRAARSLLRSRARSQG